MDMMDLVGKLADDTAKALGVERSQLDYITAEGVYERLSEGAALLEGMIKYEILELSPGMTYGSVLGHHPIIAGSIPGGAVSCRGYAAYNNGQYQCAYVSFIVYRVAFITRVGTCACGDVYRISYQV